MIYTAVATDASRTMDPTDHKKWHFRSAEVEEEGGWGSEFSFRRYGSF